MVLLRYVKAVCVGIPVAVTLIDTVGSIAKVDGTSMQPVLNPVPGSCDYVFLSKWAVRNFEIRRGDIVSLRSPREPNVHLIKRVIGLEGDVVSTNGWKQALIDVPPGHCWLEGDHTGNSIDSNSFGPVAVGMILCKATAVVWPPERWQKLDSRIPEGRAPLHINEKAQQQQTL